jgi:hypothetical protein
MKTVRKFINTVSFLCIFGLCASAGLLAQGYGTIGGTVTDPTGAVVPGAEVTATQAATGLMLKTTTNDQGAFSFPSLAPAVYNISITASGFQAYTLNSLQVRADASLTSNAQLHPGSAAETVTVNAEAAQVDVTTGTLSQVIGTSQVNDLPLNGRNAAQLTTQVAASPSRLQPRQTKAIPRPFR